MKQVKLKYYAVNNNNLAVDESLIPDRSDVVEVCVELPGQDEPKPLRALKTYKSKHYRNKPVTLRSPEIDEWLKNNFKEGQEFIAEFVEQDNKHIYKIKSIEWDCSVKKMKAD